MATKLLSLFSGCGGFDQGFADAGISASCAFDLDRDAISNYRRNLGPAIHRLDLTGGIPNDQMFRHVDVLIAGPPCQGFSTAGKRILDDERNNLLTLAGLLAVRIKPKVIVIENVAGVVAGAHIKFWRELTERLRLDGYKTAELACQVSRMGMAQTRKRMLLIAWRTGGEANFRFPERPFTSLRQALRGAGKHSNHEKETLIRGSDLWKIAKHIAPGQKLSNVRGGPRAVHTWQIPEVFGQTTAKERTLLELLLRLRRQKRQRDFGDSDPVSLERMAAAFGAPFRRLLRSLVKKGYVRESEGEFDLVRTYNGKFRRLDWDEPSLTVDTRFGDPRYFLHPDEPRGMTVREAARIQGFPDHFIFVGDKKAQHRVIGNAVPPPLAKVAAGFVHHLLGR